MCLFHGPLIKRFLFELAPVGGSSVNSAMTTTYQAALARRADLASEIIEHALRNPNAAAVATGDAVMTYRDLDCQSNRFANHLQSLGAGRDTLVGLCLTRSFDLVAAALGIWKAGGAFVPMDPSYPAERLSYMVKDAEVKVVITNRELAQRLGETAAEFVFASDIAEESTIPLDAGQGELAYVIYTSGSTGTPKGVEITHRGLQNLVAWHREAFCVSAGDRASHVAGLGFDASVWELWPYLAAGASVYLADDITRTSPELLRDWLVANGITISFIPTPIAERMLFLDWPRETKLRMLLTGGDALHHFPPPGLPFKLINNYGPTESTVVATSGEVRPDSAAEGLPSIGKPIRNTRIFLLDERLREAPDGTPGELHIESASLARGYRNSPELTAAKFIPNPFGPDRLYKTGDLARRLPDGQIAFMGRIDDQIKIRGYRIEPQEIVRALNRCAGVRDSHAAARSDASGEKRLIAYLNVAPDFNLTAAKLRDALREDLPGYMIPSQFVRVDAFPLTANGKVDYAALPEPDFSNTIRDEESAEPRTATEKQVAEIIATLLGLEQVDPDDNFFMLGGHSLLGAQLIARVRKDFGVQIALRTLFAAPTVAELSAEIERLAALGPQAQPPADCAVSCTEVSG